MERLAAVLTGYFIHGAAAIYLAVIAIGMGTECVGIDFFLMLNSNAVSLQAIKKQERSNYQQAAIKGFENPELAVLRQECLK